MRNCIKTHLHAIYVFLAVVNGVPLFAQNAPAPASASPQTPDISSLLPSPPKTVAGAPVEINADGEVSYDELTGLATAERNVIVKYQGAILMADKVTYSKVSRTATAQGNAYLFRDGKQWQGEMIIYNFGTRDISTTSFKAFLGNNSASTSPEGMAPAYMSGSSMTTSNGVYKVEDAVFTPTDAKNPDTRVRAKHMELHPDNRLVMRDVTIYTGDTPIMYLPYLSKDLDDRRNIITIEPGYTSRLGPFSRIGYNWKLNDYIKGKLHLDVFGKRGVGGGLDFQTKYGKDGKYGWGEYKSFVIDDSKPNSSNNNPTPPFGVSNPRYRVAAKQRNYITEDLTFMGNINWWSDRYITEDFFRREFAKEVQPDNMLDLNYYNKNFTIDLQSRVQINPFFETVERLPELDFDLKQQKLFNTPINYEGEVTVARLRRSFANEPTPQFNALLNQSSLFPPDYDATRIDTYHQLIYPYRAWGWLNLAPKAGVRGTYYSDSPNPASATFASSKREQFRGVFNTGLEASFKASRTWSESKNRFWDIDGIRHIIEPSANYVFVPTPTEKPDELYQFDTLLPSTKLSPLDFPQFNRIDAIDKRHVVRPSLRNKIQTRRGATATDKTKTNWDLVDWVMFADINIEANKRLGEGQFSDIYNEVTLRPLRWWSMEIDSRNSTDDGNLNEFNTTSTFRVAGNFDANFYTRYINRSQFFPDSNLLGPGFAYRLNEDWSVKAAWLYEADTRTLQVQEYSLMRDWPSWSTSLTLRQLDNRGSSDETQVLLMFTLKGFPELQGSAGTGVGEGPGGK
ncbi:MAG: hypothetical protein SFY92_04310 [Verrucomicrobiae bacterium]|nr:hypothetical protein [Verrucomicrobiae bacterium]